MQLDIHPLPAPWALEEKRLINACSRADTLMSWGHAAAFAGGVGGIAGGFALVAAGALNPVVSALLFVAPVAGALASVALYAAAWLADWLASRRPYTSV